MRVLTIPVCPPRHGWPFHQLVRYVSAHRVAINHTHYTTRLTLVSDHIEKNMHPQAIMIDSTDVEESYFLKGFRDGIRSTGAALIELPEKPSTRLSWITKLDSASLAGKFPHHASSF